MKETPEDHKNQIPPGEIHENLEKQASGLELVEARGFASDLLKEKSNLRPYNSWMGIGVNEKTYPDDMVKDFIKWGADKSETFLLVIADDIQTYNRIPFSKDDWDEVYNFEEFRRLGTERKERLQAWLKKEGITNVQIKQWQEIIEGLGRQDEVFLDWSSQLFDHLRSKNPDFNEAIENIAPQQVPGMFKKMQREGKGGKNLKFGKFATSLYAQDEIFLSWALALKGGYQIKIGHEGEKVYDEITANLLAGKYGEELAEPKAQFGSIYLKKAQT